MPTPFLKSSELSSLTKIRHGFFTRQGGVSEGVYSSLNCGYGSNDNGEHVKENRRRVARALHQNERALDVLDDPLATMYQTHSANVHVVYEQFDALSPPEADALVTKTPGIILGVLTADCGPILMADPKAGVIAAVHAGWKGAFSGIIENTIMVMEDLGTSRSNICAVLGPCIHQDSYEVSADFYRQFLAENRLYGAYFLPGAKPEHYQFDLPGFISSRLTESRVGEIAVMPNDTYVEKEKFFSWRRTCHENLKDYGRGISAITVEK